MSDTAGVKVRRFDRDSVRNTLFVAIGLSLVCSVLVASTAVLLKPKQLRNEEQFRQRIILEVASLMEPGGDIDELFSAIETRMVDLESGEYADSIDPRSFDALAMANDAEFGVAVPAEFDIANVQRRARYAPVYLVRRAGSLEQIILPVYGSGLWATMYGYLAVEGDGQTIAGLRFYRHGETPGLGDQVDNPAWRQLWVGKQIYGADGLPAIEIVRGAQGPSQVDAMSGATLTGRGVTHLVQYWTGPHGFGPYLARLRTTGDKAE